jgi:5-methylcytosine-specific restriction endonuclease McrA
VRHQSTVARVGQALVLNATYEPIGVVSGKRALLLALAEKVDVLADSGDVITSERFCFPIPSVVRLRYFVRVPYQRTAPLNRKAIFARDNGRCQYCGSNAESIDHVVPRSRGGEHIWTNVVACCRKCNTIKASRLLSECSMVLKTKPTAPTRLAWVTVAAGRVPESWGQYLTQAAA